MEAEEVGIPALKPDQQRLELINPGKRALGTKAVRVNRCVEEPLPPALRSFAVSLILRNIGNDTMIETDFPGCFRIKCAIRIKICSLDGQTPAFYSFEEAHKVVFEFK